MKTKFDVGDIVYVINGSQYTGSVGKITGFQTAIRQNKDTLVYYLDSLRGCSFPEEHLELIIAAKEDE